ncbi:contractile injection system tape measure protein [Gynuella sp.]|uniref:contractile injection system tape measure protein n=1 Tax=Gynuella sp. TaxID=2969146 RepID=UPI003D12E200
MTTRISHLSLALHYLQRPVCADDFEAALSRLVRQAMTTLTATAGTTITRLPEVQVDLPCIDATAFMRHPDNYFAVYLLPALRLQLEQITRGQFTLAGNGRSGQHRDTMSALKLQHYLRDDIALGFADFCAGLQKWLARPDGAIILRDWLRQPRVFQRFKRQFEANHSNTLAMDILTRLFPAEMARSLMTTAGADQDSRDTLWSLAKLMLNQPPGELQPHTWKQAISVLSLIREAGLPLTQPQQQSLLRGLIKPTHSDRLQTWLAVAGTQSVNSQMLQQLIQIVAQDHPDSTVTAQTLAAEADTDTTDVRALIRTLTEQLAALNRLERLSLSGDLMGYGRIISCIDKLSLQSQFLPADWRLRLQLHSTHGWSMQAAASLALQWLDQERAQTERLPDLSPLLTLSSLPFRTLEYLRQCRTRLRRSGANAASVVTIINELKHHLSPLTGFVHFDADNRNWHPVHQALTRIQQAGSNLEARLTLALNLSTRLTQLPMDTHLNILNWLHNPDHQPYFQAMIESLKAQGLTAVTQDEQSRTALQQPHHGIPAGVLKQWLKTLDATIRQTGEQVDQLTARSNNGGASDDGFSNASSSLAITRYLAALQLCQRWILITLSEQSAPGGLGQSARSIQPITPVLDRFYAQLPAGTSHQLRLQNWRFELIDSVTEQVSQSLPATAQEQQGADFSDQKNIIRRLTQLKKQLREMTVLSSPHVIHRQLLSTCLLLRQWLRVCHDHPQPNLRQWLIPLLHDTNRLLEQRNNPQGSHSYIEAMRGILSLLQPSQPWQPTALGNHCDRLLTCLASANEDNGDTPFVDLLTQQDLTTEPQLQRLLTATRNITRRQQHAFSQADFSAVTDPLKQQVRHLSLLSESGPRVMSDAGLSILWPFLQPWFQQQELLDSEHQWRNEAAQQKAMDLLMCLYGYDTPGTIPTCANLLTGRDTDMPYEPGILNEHEQDHCEHLLNQVIQQWPVLKQMSNSGFRSLFLHRPGTLETHEHGYTLTITPMPQDALLIKLPWGLGIVRLPWLQNCLLDVRWNSGL